MDNHEILKKVIEKGWNEDKEWVHLALGILSWIELGSDIEKSKYYPLIFSHDFAKAFWNEKPNGIVNYLGFPAWTGDCQDCGKKFDGYKQIGEIEFGHKGCPKSDTGRIWKRHLQEMVLEEDPIKYLENYL